MNIQAAENATYYYVGFVLHNSCIGWCGKGGEGPSEDPLTLFGL